MPVQACNRCHSGDFLRRSSDKASALSRQQGPATHSVRQQLCSVSGQFRTPRVCRQRSSPFVWSGPNRIHGRFKRAPCPQSIAGPEPSPEPAARQTARQGSWPLAQVTWKCLAAVAFACTTWSLNHTRSTTSSQLVTEPKPASVGWASESVHSSQHRPSSTTAKAAHLHQQPAFASISFASIISHAQRTHLVQMLVYQVQRVRLSLKLTCCG